VSSTSKIFGQFSVIRTKNCTRKINGRKWKGRGLRIVATDDSLARTIRGILLFPYSSSFSSGMDRISLWEAMALRLPNLHTTTILRERIKKRKEEGHLRHLPTQISPFHSWRFHLPKLPHVHRDGVYGKENGKTPIKAEKHELDDVLGTHL
jgi:hypothetical protein